MTRFVHDEFAKDYLEELLKPYGDLPLNHPYKQVTLELVYNLRQNLRINQNLESDDRELIMRLEPLYQQDRERAKRKDSGARVLTKVTLEGEYRKYEPKPASRIRSRKLEPVIERRTGGYHH